MTFEQYLSWINENVFLKEFTFSRNKFKPTPSEELELADNIIFMPDALMVFQAKERETTNITNDPNCELKWFHHKVLKKGTRQIRNTLSYIRDYSPILIKNHRDHELTLSDAKRRVIKVLAYDNNCLPIKATYQKHHVSKTAGFIHIISKTDYTLVVDTLFTPSEIFDYFSFREDLILKYFMDISSFSERIMIGHYLSGELEAPPSNKYESYLQQFDRSKNDFDLNYIFRNFGDKIYDEVGGQNSTDYYAILLEFAKLNRSTLRVIKERIVYCLNKIHFDSPAQPTRVYNPDTNCGFVLIPVHSDNISVRRTYLMNITAMAKYYKKVPKQIGICFALDKGEVIIDWCYMEGPFIHNNAMEQLLRINNPFKDLKEAKVPRYKFK